MGLQLPRGFWPDYPTGDSLTSTLAHLTRHTAIVLYQAIVHGVHPLSCFTQLTHTVYPDCAPSAFPHWRQLLRMLRSRELQIFRLARSGRLAAHVRHASSSNSRSPRDVSTAVPGACYRWSCEADISLQLYNHLSQYIVGQERAKKVLSVA